MTIYIKQSLPKGPLGFKVYTSGVSHP